MSDAETTVSRVLPSSRTNQQTKGRWLLWRAVLAMLVASPVPLAFAQAPTAPPFQSGDRVCFIGDSITDIGLYHSYLQLFYATRFPDRQIQYFPAGFSGGFAEDCLRRLQWDILARNPNVATVNFGMNDMGGDFGAPKASPEEVDKAIQERMNSVQIHYEKLLDALSAAGVRLVLMGPSIYDDTVQIDKNPPARANRPLTLWTQRVKEIAERRKLGFVDLNTKMKEVNARLQAADAKATIVGGDRVHPGAQGNLVMAYSILKAQGIGPEVATVSVDAATGKADKLVNCTVEAIERTANGISFRCLEKALPFPTPYRAEKSLELIPFTEELNREMLVVRNLPAGRYELRIDDAVVGQYDARALGEGVNLALNPDTPQYKQAQKLLADNDRRHQLENKLRYFPFLRHWLKEMEQIDMNDPVAVEKFLREKTAALKPDDFGRYMAETYLKDVAGKTDVIQKEVQELKGKMERERVPEAHKFALGRVH